MACLLSIRCCVNFHLLLLYLKSDTCSWNLTLNGLPICPVYFILHSGHDGWCTLLLSYLLWGRSCFTARHFPIVLSVVNAFFTFTSRKFCALCHVIFLSETGKYSHTLYTTRLHIEIPTTMWCLFCPGFKTVKHIGLVTQTGLLDAHLQWFKLPSSIDCLGSSQPVRRFLQPSLSCDYAFENPYFCVLKSSIGYFSAVFGTICG